MVMSQDQNADGSHSIKTENSFFEWVEEFKYLGTTLTNQNSIQEEIKSRFRECLLSFGTESFVFQFAIQKFKDSGIQKYNFACCFVWMLNSVAHIEGGT
jgi:hypothetical protein